MPIYKIQMSGGRASTIDGANLVLSRWKGVLPKYCIYVFRCREKIIYVGETGRGVYRCLHGLFSSHGTDLYPWRNDSDVRNEELELMVVSLDLPYAFRKQAKYKKVVEAEVAYEIRLKTGVWPTKLRGLTINAHIARGTMVTRAVKKVMDLLKHHKWI